MKGYFVTMLISCLSSNFSLPSLAGNNGSCLNQLSPRYLTNEDFLILSLLLHFLLIILLYGRVFLFPKLCIICFYLYGLIDFYIMKWLQFFIILIFCSTCLKLASGGPFKLAFHPFDMLPLFFSYCLYFLAQKDVQGLCCVWSASLVLAVSLRSGSFRWRMVFRNQCRL